MAESSDAGTSVDADHPQTKKTNKIQVSYNKKPLYFYVNLAEVRHISLYISPYFLLRFSVMIRCINFICLFINLRLQPFLILCSFWFISCNHLTHWFYMFTHRSPFMYQPMRNYGQNLSALSILLAFSFCNNLMDRCILIREIFIYISASYIHIVMFQILKLLIRLCSTGCFS